MTLVPRRLASVDIFRALTMFLMIFVNDLGSLKQIPRWLEHAGMEEDRLGLADIVFPAFLFIVGLSIPFAIKARLSKDNSKTNTLIHILIRSFSLLLIGIYHVNLESYNRLESLLPKPLWQIGITLGFFLVWLDYSPAMPKKKRVWLQGSGIVLLVILSLLYKGGTPGNTTWIEPRWYGILGLIGWCYLLTAVLYLFSKDRLAVLVGALIFFLGFTIAAKAEWLDFLDPVREYFWIVSSGALPAITMAGAVTSVLYRKFAEKGKGEQSLIILLMLALVFLAGGFALRPFWGISKIRATPSWVMICIAISLGCFLLLIYIADIKKKQDWARIIRPAGTSTLTCYLLPYIHYAFLNLFGPSSRLPMALRTGGVGVLKSLLYSLLIILITGLLEKKRLRLKL